MSKQDTVTEITPLDHKLLQVGVHTSTTTRLPSQIQVTKTHFTPEKRVPLPIARNLELIRENGHLRQELAYFRSREKALVQLFHQCMDMQKQMNTAVKSFSDAAALHEHELFTAIGVDRVDLNGQDDFRLI